MIATDVACVSSHRFAFVHARVYAATVTKAVTLRIGNAMGSRFRETDRTLSTCVLFHTACVLSCRFTTIHVCIYTAMVADAAALRIGSAVGRRFSRSILHFAFLG